VDAGRYEGMYCNGWTYYKLSFQSFGYSYNQ
jgi:hypothetical protein